MSEKFATQIEILEKNKQKYLKTIEEKTKNNEDTSTDQRVLKDITNRIEQLKNARELTEKEAEIEKLQGETLVLLNEIVNEIHKHNLYDEYREELRQENGNRTQARDTVLKYAKMVNMEEQSLKLIELYKEMKEKKQSIKLT